MSLAPYVRILGRGPGRARPLDRAEAAEAMRIIMAGQADPESLGALLMLMRYRGESAGEIAGFVEAIGETLAGQGWRGIGAALDWPSFAAGRTRGAPLFVLSALLVAQAGYRVHLHGYNSHQGTHASVRDALGPLGIKICETPKAATLALGADNIAYTPLEALSPDVFNLLKLRSKFNLRSCINTVARMLNPSAAPAAVQGVFHPSYRDLQSDAALLLGRETLSVIKGGGGEFERHPSKSVLAYGLRGGVKSEVSAPPLLDETRRLHEADGAGITCAALWSGTAEDDFATATVVGTAGLALYTLGAVPDVAAGDKMAADLWATRSKTPISAGEDA